jgi:hypothetical protein
MENSCPHNAVSYTGQGTVICHLCGRSAPVLPLWPDQVSISVVVKHEEKKDEASEA